MSDGDGFRVRALYALERAEKTVDPATRRELGKLALVEPIMGDYFHGLECLSRKRPAKSQLLLLFLGSTIGNLERSEQREFLRAVRRRLRPEAVWNPAERRMEMYLVSREEQDVRVGALDLTVHFREGESIWTESSHKFTVEELETLAKDSEFEVLDQWGDSEWPLIETLWRA